MLTIAKIWFNTCDFNVKNSKGSPMTAQAAAQKEEFAMPENVHLIDHPLIHDKLSIMRDRNTKMQDFRALINEVAMLMGYEIFRDLPLTEKEIETPLEKMRAKVLAEKEICLVSILRAGNGFLDGIMNLVPTARVGFVGLYRDPDTLQPVEYYLKFPTTMGSGCVVVVDPMLATGNSAAAAVQRVKDHGAKDIRFMCLLAAPEGIAAFHRAHPDVPVYTAAVDRCLNDHGYILPGLGDAGDRIFGTK